MKKSLCSLFLLNLLAVGAAKGELRAVDGDICGTSNVDLLNVGTLDLSDSAAQSAQAQQASQESRTGGSGEQSTGRRRLDASEFPDVKLLLDQGKVLDAIQVLEQKQPSNENNAQFFNLLGVLYLQQKQFASAAAAFERVVLIESDNAGAWLDLAIAKMESGEYAQANQFFDYIVDTHKPTRHILNVIETYRSRMKTAIDENKPWRNQFEASAGRDTNANSGILADHLLVTFDGKQIDVPLVQYKARPDNFHQISNRTHFQSKLFDQNFAFDTAIVNRSFMREHAYSYTDVNMGMSLSHRFPTFEIGMSGSVEHFIWGNRALLNNSEITWFAEKHFAACQTSFVLDYESRRYVQSAALNARSLWSNLGASCGGELTHGYRWEGAVVVRRADDKPIGFRAGGTTSRQENIIRLGIKTPYQLRADLSFSFGRAADSEGYSALLNDNAKRFMQRRNYRLQLSYPFARELTGFVGYEDARNDSNLELFQQRGHSLCTGLRFNY
ncbi:MAG: tetratricopeptide repeat protein [Burkholderiaceae bacterium]|nr:MAG: tetratricopeptide repeat protein [Burkholderiaceae bacterium]